MQREYKNKQMAVGSVSTKAPAETGVPQEEFFFSGGGEYQPLTVTAESRDQAEEIWKERRIPTPKP